jgi:general secretion pathway protein D
MKRLTQMTASLLLTLLSACAGDMRRQQLDAQLSGLPPDEAVELLAQQSAQYPDDLQIRSQYLRMRRSVMEEYLTRATTAYDANDFAQARMWAQKAQQAAPGDDSPRQVLEWIDTQGPIDSALQYAESIRAERPDEALAVAGDVLGRQPGNVRAARLRDELLTPRSRQLTPTLTRDLSQPITVQFRDQPLISIFELVSNITGLNFTFDHDVAATAPTTIFASNTPVKQVMAMVLQANQLASKVVNGTSLLIYPKRQDKDTEYRDLAVRTFYLQNAQAPQVLAVLKQMVKTRDAVVDERTNAIIMRDAPETIKVAERLIAAMDVTPAEVVLEAQIIEVSSTDLLQLGVRYPERIEFGIQPRTSSTDTTTLPAGYVTLDELHHLNSGDVIVRLGTVGVDWLQSMGKTKTLANPRIRVRNREKAKVLIGDRLPVVTTTLSSNFSSESVNYQDVGLTLEVQPVISNAREVQVKLKLEVSNVTDTITTTSGLVAYQIGTRTAETVMSVNNNETQILAGLLQRNERSASQGIPGLSRIPLFDRIFGVKVDDGKQTELILLLTPRIVRNQAIPPGNAVAFDSGTETRITTEGDGLSGGDGVRVPPKGMNTPPPALEPPGGRKP